MLTGSRERAPHAKIAHVLRGLVDRHGWEAMTEGDNIIGAQVCLSSQRDHLGTCMMIHRCRHGTVHAFALRRSAAAGSKCYF